jgi:hypothetical protein
VSRQIGATGIKFKPDLLSKPNFGTHDGVPAKQLGPKVGCKMSQSVNSQLMPLVVSSYATTRLAFKSEDDSQFMPLPTRANTDTIWQ